MHGKEFVNGIRKNSRKTTIYRTIKKMAEPNRFDKNCYWC